MTHTDAYIKEVIDSCSSFIKGLDSNLKEVKLRLKDFSKAKKLIEEGDFNHFRILLDKELLEVKKAIDNCEITGNFELAIYWKDYLMKLNNCKNEIIG